MNRSGAINRIPTELWTMIFCFATEVPNWDEFARDHPTLIPNLVSKSPSEPCFFPRDIRRETLRTRLHLVLVCKHWCHVAMPVLWSHLVIDVIKWLRNRSQVRSMLNAKSYLCSFITRLDIEYPAEPDPLYEDDAKVIKGVKKLLHNHLFPHLHKLRVLYAPHAVAIGEFPIYPEVTCLYPGGYISYRHSVLENDDGGTDYPWDPRSHFWRNTRILDVDLGSSELSFEKASTGEPIVFPRLDQLRIRLGINTAILASIVSRWQAPKLETLSIWFEDFQIRLPLLAWSRLTIVSLHLQGCADIESNPVELPKLRQLFIRKCFTKGWYKVIVAPNLEAIQFEDHHVDILYAERRGVFIDYIARIFKIYLACQSVSYLHWEADMPKPTNLVWTVSRDPHFEIKFEPLDMK
jgi:hypothetical protein